jgi:hypothetical protein
MEGKTMKTLILRASALVVLLTVTGLLLAGTLDPPGPPAPTMVTLQQIYDRIGAALGGTPRTGQTGCWNTGGTSIACANTGQDGAFQSGSSVTPRFTDNANGTVRDNLTGLVWLKNANCWGLQTWNNALSMSNSLGHGGCSLTDGSSPGDWRLPNVKELLSLIDYGHVNPVLPGGYPFSGVQLLDYWTSTTDFNSPPSAWRVDLGGGAANHNNPGSLKTGSLYVWPVRGGQ